MYAGDQMQVEIERVIEKGDAVVGAEMDYAPGSRKVVLELALEPAPYLSHKHGGAGHTLIELFRERNGVTARVLDSMGADLEDVHAAIMDLLEPSDSQISSAYLERVTTPEF